MPFLSVKVKFPLVPLKHPSMVWLSSPCADSTEAGHRPAGLTECKVLRPEGLVREGWRGLLFQSVENTERAQFALTEATSLNQDPVIA